MKHWAAPLIGKPWTESFTCWSLVQHVFAMRYDIAMPDMAITTDAAVRAIKHAAEVSGWRRADEPAQDGDIVLMTGLRGRHVGVVIDVDGKILLLHNDGHLTPRGPTGGVVAQPLADAMRDGFHSFELWRYFP